VSLEEKLVECLIRDFVYWDLRNCSKQRRRVCRVMSVSKGPKKGTSQVTRGEFGRSVKVFLVGLFRRFWAKSVNFLTFCSTIPDSLT
jgi:hypothetical protein